MKSLSLIALTISSCALSIACASAGLAQQTIRDAKAELNLQPGHYRLVSFKNSYDPDQAANPYCENMDISWEDHTDANNQPNPLLDFGPRLVFGDINGAPVVDPASPLDPDACSTTYTTSTAPNQLKAIRTTNCKWGQSTFQIHLQVSGDTLKYTIITKSPDDQKLVSNQIDCVLKLQP